MSKASDSKESKDSKGSSTDYCKGDGKFSDDAGDDFAADAKSFEPNPPRINITAIEIDPVEAEITKPFRLRIAFDLDRDCVASYWCVKFLVDSGEKRVIKVGCSVAGMMSSSLRDCAGVDIGRDKG
jgi:hypothetical protein